MIPALWIHKVGVHKTVYLLYQFNGCKGFSFYLLRSIRRFCSCPEGIYSLPESALLPKNHPKIIKIPG